MDNCTTTPPEQLSLFTPERLPKRPYCKDGKAEANLIRSLKSALKRPYIQINPPKLRFWSVFDIDRAGAALAWEEAGLPPPAWAAVSPANAHAHLAWGLSAPVLTGEAGRDAPLRYLAAIEGAMRAKLGADDGFTGVITKNPAHPNWRTLWGPPHPYELGELAEYLDLTKHRPRAGVRVENVGLGRNCTLFDRVRVWAYRAIREYRGQRHGIQAWNAWLEEVRTEALVFNGDFAMVGGEWHSRSGPLGERECYWVAKSVAKWVWQKDAGAHAKFLDRQAAKGRASGIARLAASENQRACARLMAAQGTSKSEIARTLEVPRSTVVRWLHD